MEWKFKDNEKDINDSIGLLISILVRYPQVGTINYDPKSQVLKFTFIFSAALAKPEIESFDKALKDSIEAYNFLENKKPSIIDMDYHFCDNFTLLEISRDVNTLAKEELSLIIEIVQSNFEGFLVSEENEHFQEDELMMQEELIEHMLENLKRTTIEKNLIAFREDGRVLVFNK